jgi:hypothetical protein
VSTRLFFASSIWLFASQDALPQSAYYDKYAYIRHLPDSPPLPRQPADCHEYSTKADRFVQELKTAHDSCLRVESKANSTISDVLGKCSNSACENLHVALARTRQEAERKKTMCFDALKKAPAWKAENERLKAYDKPVQADPIGNALIGGAVTGAVKGATAGATSAVRGATIGTAASETKKIAKDKGDNSDRGNPKAQPAEPRQTSPSVPEGKGF